MRPQSMLLPIVAPKFLVNYTCCSYNLTSNNMSPEIRPCLRGEAHNPSSFCAVMRNELMLISVKHNFVFFCTPKCASNSIEAMLQPFSDISLLGPPYFRHTNFRRYNKYISPFIENATRGDSLETICLVRDPISWLYSYYRFRSRFQIRNPNHPRFSSSTYKISFAEFVSAYMSQDPPPFADVGCQFNFVKNELDQIGIEKLCPYENIEDFIQYMSRKVESPLKIGFKNVSPRNRNESNLRELVSYATRKIARTLNLNLSTVKEEVDYQLSDELVNSLRTYMADDFALYQYAKDSQLESR